MAAGHKKQSKKTETDYLLINQMDIILGKIVNAIMEQDLHSKSINKRLLFNSQANWIFKLFMGMYHDLVQLYKMKENGTSNVDDDGLYKIVLGSGFELSRLFLDSALEIIKSTDGRQLKQYSSNELEKLIEASFPDYKAPSTLGSKEYIDKLLKGIASDDNTTKNSGMTHSKESVDMLKVNHIRALSYTYRGGKVLLMTLMVLISISIKQQLTEKELRQTRLLAENKIIVGFIERFSRQAYEITKIINVLKNDTDSGMGPTTPSSSSSLSQTQNPKTSGKNKDDDDTDSEGEGEDKSNVPEPITSIMIRRQSGISMILSKPVNYYETQFLQGIQKFVNQQQVFLELICSDIVVYMDEKKENLVWYYPHDLSIWLSDYKDHCGLSYSLHGLIKQMNGGASPLSV